jgi:hypothetical protein
MANMTKIFENIPTGKRGKPLLKEVKPKWKRLEQE